MATMTVRGVSVVVPTYREVANLPRLIPRLISVLNRLGTAYEVIVVDDNSCDGTEEVVREFQACNSVKLLTRLNDRGLASAVVHGFAHTVFDVLVCMDADLSHPPESLPDVIHPVLAGENDLCIGSRYVSGGRTLDDWGRLRRLNSRVATLLARPLVVARDPMAGFFCLSRALYERACNAGINPIGYKIGLELAVRGGCKAPAEAPIVFGNRQHGSSKLSGRQQWLYLRQLGSLYRFQWGRWWESRRRNRNRLSMVNPGVSTSHTPVD